MPHEISNSSSFFEESSTGWDDPSPTPSTNGFGSSDAWGSPSDSNNRGSSSGGRAGGSGGKGCFKCGEEGHMSRECPSGGGSSRGGGGRGCHKCGEEGHMARECPSGGDSPRGGGKGCFKCGEEGHMSRECPSGGESPRGGGGRGCHKCGKEGHMAKDCSEQALDADGKPRAPLYKPPDIEEDDNLFESVCTGENFDRFDVIPCHVTGDDVPKNPERYETFEEAFTSETILKGLKQSKITRPTPIQKYGMRIVMAGRDLMACAQTGSGKTLAFVLPILQDLFNDKELRSGYGEMPAKPKALIISPTRELAVQIYKEAYKYSRGSIVKVQIVYGGTSVAHQRAKLSEGVHILIGTVGRMLDFLNRGVYDFSNLKYLVLDEADRMIDEGFLPDVRKMMVHATMPPKEKRQTLMFSATFDTKVQNTAQDFLNPDYLFLTVGILGAANSDVEQNLIKVDKFAKREKLVEILNSCDDNDKTMVFVESKKTADFLASYLSQNQFKATSIHGDRFQFQREKALADLKSGKYPVLVATSVAARGLDIADVRHVINYDLPSHIDDYVHRIGRTGRVGHKGKATSFYDPSSDKPLAEKIIAIIEKVNQSVPEWLKDEAGGGSVDFDGDFGGTDMRDMKISDNNASNSNNDAEEDWG